MRLCMQPSGRTLSKATIYFVVGVLHLLKETQSEIRPRVCSLIPQGDSIIQQSLWHGMILLYMACVLPCGYIAVET